MEEKDKEGKEEKAATTPEDMKGMIESQNQIIEAMRTESATTVSAMKDAYEKQFGDLALQMTNITNLIGGLAGKETDEYNTYGGESDNEKTPEEIANAVFDKRKKADADLAAKENKVYNDGYSGALTTLLNEESAPDGKPLATDVRDNMIKLLKMEEFMKVHTGNAATDAIKNFKMAYKRLFGLDRTHGFKGEENIEGTGVGGGSAKDKKTKTYTLSKSAKEFLSKTGMSEEDGQRLLKNKEERESLTGVE